jgi:hypothetical protein
MELIIAADSELLGCEEEAAPVVAVLVSTVAGLEESPGRVESVAWEEGDVGLAQSGS